MDDLVGRAPRWSNRPARAKMVPMRKHRQLRGTADEHLWQARTHEANLEAMAQQVHSNSEAGVCPAALSFLFGVLREDAKRMAHQQQASGERPRAGKTAQSAVAAFDHYCQVSRRTRSKR